MSCNIPKEVEEYLQIVENGIACKEQKALAKLVRRAFAKEKLFVDLEKFSKYLSLEKYAPFKLFEWQKFLLCIWDCVYKEDKTTPRWDTVFCMVGRGAGKDGFIAYDSMCNVSPYNPIDHADVDICANNEDQAMRPLQDFIEMLENPKHEKKLKNHYYHTKEIAQGKKNKGNIKGHTNNPKGRDGLRPAKIIFNEVHQYEDYRNIEVFTSALGKRGESRTGFFTSNGYIADGVLDSYLDKSEQILFDGKEDGGFLPFICRLDNKDDVHNHANWVKANPSLPYMPNLQRELVREYEAWKERPDEHLDFMTKRMGLRVGVTDLMVTDYENIKRTNKPLPKLNGWSCVVGIDYATLTDWAAVNIHFKRGEKRYDINHAWLCLNSRDLNRIKAPWKDWAEQGHVTVVDAPMISPDLIARYIAEAAQKYKIKMLAFDLFRVSLLEDALRKIGFSREKKNIKFIRPSDVMQVAPVIDYCFENDLFTWGDAPQLRWATNNTKRERKGKKDGTDTGNFFYAKIEAKSRKTDPFMALVASMTCENLLDGKSGKITLPPIGAIKI